MAVPLICLMVPLLVHCAMLRRGVLIVADGSVVVLSYSGPHRVKTFGELTLPME